MWLPKRNALVLKYVLDMDKGKYINKYIYLYLLIHPQINICVMYICIHRVSSESGFALIQGVGSDVHIRTIA
jgi:hypothetical protein